MLNFEIDSSKGFMLAEFSDIKGDAAHFVHFPTLDEVLEYLLAAYSDPTNAQDMLENLVATMNGGEYPDDPAYLLFKVGSFKLNWRVI